MARCSPEAATGRKGTIIENLLGSFASLDFHAGVQHLPDFTHQGRQCERFRKEPDSLFQHAVVRDRIVGVPGDTASLYWARFSGSAQPAGGTHRRHDYIGDHQPDSMILFANGQAFLGAFRDQHLVSAMGEYRTERAKLRVIFHQQNGLGAALDAAGMFFAIQSLGQSGRRGESKF
jgi:hypothetical protein